MLQRLDCPALLASPVLNCWERYRWAVVASTHAAAVLLCEMRRLRISESPVFPMLSTLPLSNPAGSAAAAAASPSIRLLHRHALESVFAFCSLSELAAIIAVAREWQAAVLRMAPLGLRLNGCSSKQMALLCHSPLRRHVAFLDCLGSCDIFVSPERIHLMSHRLPQLRELTVTVRPPMPSGVALQFPPGLRLLRLVLQSEKDDGNDVGFAELFNAALDAAASLEQLQDLQLHIRGLSHGREFPGSLAALTRARSLRHLKFALGGFQVPRFGDAHVADLRALVQLHTLAFNRVNTPLLRRLLAPPHALRWQELGGLWQLTKDDAALLVSLSLRTLYANLAMPHADFLLQLPQLTTLRLSAAGQGPPDTERILQAVGTCAQLRSLTLEDSESVNMLHLRSAQLGACLTRLPNLQELDLSGATELTTLSFLEVGSVRGTLIKLFLLDFSHRMPLSELQFVLQLRELQSLAVWDVFDAPLCAADLALLTPPTQSPLLPRLTKFSYRHREAAV